MIDLSPRNLEIVKRVLRDHVPGCEVRAFGSRAKWTAKDYSDLDLAVVSESEIGDDTLARLREAFEDSSLPMRVDVLDWQSTSPAFRKVIERDCVELATGDGASSWRRTTLGACASLVGDKVSPSDCGDLPYIGLEHVGQGTLSLLGTGKASDVESTKTAFRAGDILFGKLRPYFRKVVRPDFDGICSTDIWVVRPKAGVDAGYLFYLMASKAFVDFASQGVEGTRMPRAKWEHVAQYAVCLPSVVEQCAIAQTLGALDEKIELNLHMVETLSASVKGLFRLRFDLHDQPVDWPKKSLADVASVVRGRSYTSEELTESSATAMVSLKSFERGGGYRSEGLKAFSGPYKAEQIVTPGEVVIACTDVTQAAEVIGRPAVVPPSRIYRTLVASLDVLVLRPASVGIGAAFLYGLTSTRRFVEHAKSYATGTTVLHLDQKAVPTFQFACPPRELVAMYSRLAEPQVERCSKVIHEADCLQELRDTLLPKLLSGEIRIRDAEKLAEAAT